MNGKREEEFGLLWEGKGEQPRGCVRKCLGRGAKEGAGPGTFVVLAIAI